MKPTKVKQKPKIITESLICKLTEKGRREARFALALELSNHDRADEQRKLDAEAWKDRLAGIRATIHTLQRKVETGQEWRDVQCEVRLGEPDDLHKTTVRTDTGEVVRVERLTNDERQGDLPLDGGNVIDLDDEDDEQPEPEE